MGQRLWRRGGVQSAAAVGVARRDRVRGIGWRKSWRFLALVEVSSRREKLIKDGHQSYRHCMIIVVLLQRAWEGKRLGGLWLPVRYGGDANIYA